MMLQIVKPRIVQLRGCLLYHVKQSTLARARSCSQFQISSNGQLERTENDKLKSEQSMPNIRIDLSRIQKFRTDQSNRSPENEFNKIPADEDTNSNKPSREHLDEFYSYIENSFPKFFREKLNHNYFEPDVQLEDNQSGVPKITYGIPQLVSKISIVRIYYSLMYSFNVMSVLSMAKLYDEGLVKVRWRISSKGRLFVFLQFWRVRNFRRAEYFNDGIVYFYLNETGRVYRITLEKIEKNKQEKLIEAPLRKVVKDLV